jgi:hypothetical protein
MASVRLAQVDGADVGVEPLGDEVDDVLERLVQVVRARDDPGDVGEECDPVGNARPPRSGPHFRECTGMAG